VIDDPLELIRASCSRLLEVTERVSHGDPAFFVAKKCFVMVKNNHSCAGWLAFWCASTLEFRAAMLERDAQMYFVPPYVGHRGWLGVRLQRFPCLWSPFPQTWRAVRVEKDSVS
jgi:hypothetical protein